MPEPAGPPSAGPAGTAAGGSAILVTGSADGLGLAAAEELVRRGHRVLGHARSPERADQLRSRLPGLAEVVVGDVGSFAGVRAVADGVHRWGSVDAVIHNVAVGYREPQRTLTPDGREFVLQVNVLTPYLLTLWLPRPARLVWLSSRLHQQGTADLGDLEWERRPWDGFQAYCDSKLYDATLALAFARLWPDVVSNAMEPGWVPTRMGGADATGDLAQAHLTQVWLAEGADPDALRSGRFLHHLKEAPVHDAARDPAFQDDLLAACARLTGVGFNA